MSFVGLPPADQARLQRIAEHLVICGPRVVAEALAEAIETGDLDWLERYQLLDRAALDVTGGASFPHWGPVLVPPTDDREGA